MTVPGGDTGWPEMQMGAESEKADGAGGAEGRTTLQQEARGRRDGNR